jgi:hypothetical protein
VASLFMKFDISSLAVNPAQRIYDNTDRAEKMPDAIRGCGRRTGGEWPNSRTRLL